MLDVEIKHEIDKNYLIIHGSDENTYMLKMLAGNSVKGFLDLEVRVLNNVNQYYYDITGKENFLQKSARSKWTEEELRKMVSDILGCLQKSKEYLLTPEHFVLEPKYLYRSMEHGEVFLCYAWGYEKNINEQLTELFAYFMNVVDYEDDYAVDLVYKLYDASREENCTLQRLWSALAVPKVKRVMIEEEVVEEAEEQRSYKTRKALGLKKQGEQCASNTQYQKKSSLKPLNRDEQREGAVSKALSSKKQGHRLPSKLSSSKKQGESEKPKPLGQKKQGKRPESKPLSRKKQGEKSVLNFLRATSGKDMKTSNENSETLNGNTRKKENVESAENSVLLKILLIAVLQLIIIGLLFVGAKYGFFFENGGISYTKTGGTLLILGVLDMYLMTKIFEVEMLEEESAAGVRLEERKLSKEARTEKRERYPSPIKRKQPLPFVLASEVEQDVENEVGCQSDRLQRKEQLEEKAESKDLDGTVVLDYERTIIDNPHPDLLQSRNKKMCYLVPDKKDYSVISLGEFPFFIGRFQKDTCSLKEIKNISRMHSKIEQIGSSFFITDLDSTNGTFVNQKRLEKNKKTELYEGDIVTFANVPYHFTMQEI